MNIQRIVQKAIKKYMKKYQPKRLAAGKDWEKEKVYYQTDGTKAGDFKYKDLNGDGIINEDDMDILGDGFPTLNYGLNLGASYKNWDFSVYLYGVLGQDIFSYSAMRLSNMFSSDDGCAPNILKEAAAQAWSPENPNGTLSRLSFLDPNYNMRASDMWEIGRAHV